MLELHIYVDSFCYLFVFIFVFLQKNYRGFHTLAMSVRAADPMLVPVSLTPNIDSAVAIEHWPSNVSSHLHKLSELY